MTVASAPSRRTVFFVLTALVLAEVVSAVEATMIFAALRVFYKDFGDPVMVGWIVTAFLLVAAASASVCSRLGDMYGRRRMLLGVLAFAGLGSIVSGASDSAAGVIAGRAIQGLSGAVLPLCFGLVRENLPMRRVPFGIGVISAAAFVSGGAAIFLGGVIVDQLSSRWIFHVGAATAVIAWVAVMAWVPKSARAPSSDPVDILGALLLVPAVTGLLLALSQAKVWGWGDVRTLSLTAGCLAVLALWTLHELRTKAPLIDVRLLGNRQLALANLGVVVLALGPLQSGLVLSLLLQQPQWTGIGLGLTATMAGAVLAPPMMLAILVGPGCGGLAARYGARVPALLACVCLLAGWGGIAIHHDSRRLRRRDGGGAGRRHGDGLRRRADADRRGGAGRPHQRSHRRLVDRALRLQRRRLAGRGGAAGAIDGQQCGARAGCVSGAVGVRDDAVADCGAERGGAFDHAGVAAQGRGTRCGGAVAG